MGEANATPRRFGKRARCAIYTRKSSEEGLDQAFNSLDAQREACAAFILSQKHEGWTASPALYDDGGYSGGTMERPALKRLIADIEAGQIDVVVVYKVDRLTRALSDFARLVDVFDRRGVSFVSITQQFNTTTSMGRLTLNVLLSFAQFEREVIGERVRDKIAASKKKGMWMGGMPPLGYDVKDRKLVVNENEAKIVVHIFERYLALKSVRALGDDLASAGINSKRRLRRGGEVYGGQTLTRGALYAMLQNRLYRGEISYKGGVYPGEHPAIVEASLWDAAQATLAGNRVERATGVCANHPSLLTGMAFDDAGERLTPSHAVKRGARYRYYVSTSLVTGARTNRSGGRRIPASDLETLVIDRLRAFFNDPGALVDDLGAGAPDASGCERLIEGGRILAEALTADAPDKVKARLMTLQCRVDVKPDCVDITLSKGRLTELLSRSIGLEAPCQGETIAADEMLRLTAPAALKRVGRGLRLLVENAADRTAADPSLLKILARAHDIQTRLTRDPRLSVHDVAREEQVSAAYLYTLLRLPWLAPDITMALVNGRQPPHLTAKTLKRLAARLSPDWAQQRALLGIR